MYVSITPVYATGRHIRGDRRVIAGQVVVCVGNLCAISCRIPLSVLKKPGIGVMLRG